MHPLSTRISLLLVACAMLSTGCKEPTPEEKDFQSSKKLAEMGASQGHFNLGTHYEKGIGVRKDDEMAIESYKRGLMIIWEEERKLPTTLEGWKRLATESEYNTRQKFLVGAYYDGKLRYGNSDIYFTDKPSHFVEDTKEAIKWYKEATKDKWTSDCLGAYIRLSELSNNEESARDYLETASNRGSAVAKTLLSDYYLYDNSNDTFYVNGQRRTIINGPRPVRELQTFIQGIMLLEEAAEIGGSYASGKLYWIYNNFDGKYPTGKDEAKAWMYRRKDDEQSAASRECEIWFLDQSPPLKLASMIPNLKEGTSDAIVRRLQALKGDPKALYALSVYYAYGKVFLKDTTEAIRLCKKSAALGYPLALMSLGNRYYDGNGVIKDEIEAYAYWNLAGCENKKAHDYITKIEEKMTEAGRLLGQKRTRELQAEVEANKSKLSRK